MADIKGINIVIDGNTTPLQKALSGVNKDLKSVQGTLRAVDKALKLDPSNVELLEKKEKSLQEAVDDVKEKLDLEKKALEQLKAQDDGSEEMAKRQKELEREITQTEASLMGYESELADTRATIAGVTDESEDAADSQEDLGDAAEEAGEQAEKSGDGWSVTKQILVDFAEGAAKMAIDAVKKLASAMKDAVVDSAAYADEILSLSTQTHLSTDTLQEFQYMAELVDVDLGTVTGSLTKLTNNMQTAATGSGAMAETFSSLGVSVTDTNGEMRSAEDVFYDLIDALGKVDNETERDALAMDIFGKSAQDLNPLIDAGTDAIKAFADEAHETGYVLDEDTLSALGEVDDSFQRMKTTMTATRNQIIGQMAPALAEGGNKLLEFAQSVDWAQVGETIGGVLNKIGEYLPPIIEKIKEVYNYVESNIIPGVERVWEIIEPTVQQIRDFIAENAPAIQEIMGAAMEAIGNIVEKVWPLIQQIITNVLNTIRNIINVVTAAIHGDWRAVWDNIKQLVTDRLQGVFNIIKSVFERVKTTVLTIWSGIKSTITTTVDNIKTKVSTTFDKIKTAITKPVEDAKAKVKEIVDNIKGLFDFEWTLPKFKLPHLSVTGGTPPYGIGGAGSLPSFDIKWYRKAMDNALLLKDATVFGMNGNGSLMGGGEAGKEVILGLDKLKEYAGNKTINMNFTVNAAPGQDPRAIAREVSNIIQSEVMHKKAVWA